MQKLDDAIFKMIHDLINLTFSAGEDKYQSDDQNSYANNQGRPVGRAYGNVHSQEAKTV